MFENMQEADGDFKELDVLQEKANREYRKNFHEAKRTYYKEKNNSNKINNININNSNDKETISSQLKGNNNINENNNNNNNNNKLNDTHNKNVRNKNLRQRKQYRNQISNTLNIDNNKNIDNNNNNLTIINKNNIKYPQNPYNFTRTIPTNLINNLKDIAQNYYEIKCAEAKNCHDRSKLQTNLRIYEDEYHRKMNYLRSIPARYAQEVQKIRKELPKGNKQLDAINILIHTYTKEIDNAKIIAANSMPTHLPPSSDRNNNNKSNNKNHNNINIVQNHNRSSSSSFNSNEYYNNNTNSPYEISTIVPTKLPITKHQQHQQQQPQSNSYKKSDIKYKKTEGNLNNQSQQQQQQQEQNQQSQQQQQHKNYHQQIKQQHQQQQQSKSNNYTNTSHRSLSRFSTGKFATSKSKLTNIIARLRLRARDEFKAKVNAVRDTTRRESDFANHMKLLRDEYYSAIQRINKIPTMNKEFGLKYVQSLQKAQRSLKGKDPELDDLLDYLRKEHQIQT